MLVAGNNTITIGSPTVIHNEETIDLTVKVVNIDGSLTGVADR